MEKKKKEKKNSKISKKILVQVFLWLLILVMGILFLIFNIKYDYDKNIKKFKERKVEKKIEEFKKITIYSINEKCTYLKALEVEINKDKDKGTMILNIFEKLKEHSNSFIDEKSVLINVYFENEKLYLNLNKDFTKQMKTPEKETVIIYSIVNTFNKLEGIDKVKFLINNKNVESLGGFIEATGFFEEDNLLIKGD